MEILQSSYAPLGPSIYCLRPKNIRSISQAHPLECLEITAQNNPVLQWHSKNIRSFIIPPPPNFFSFCPPPPKKKKKILKFKFEPLKMARAYVYMEVSEYPLPTHWLTPSSPALCSVFVDVPLGGIMKL